MREIKDHIVNGDLPQNQLNIEVVGSTGAGGAQHLYKITGQDMTNNPDADLMDMEPAQWILFQNGPIKEAGVNGITQEALLAVVIDRLRSFQAGPFPCEAIASALDHCKEALECLKDRTRQRLRRGVEGENKA